MEFSKIKLSFPDKDSIKYNVSTTSQGKLMVTCVMKYKASLCDRMVDALAAMMDVRGGKTGYVIPVMAGFKECTAIGKAVLDPHDSYDLETGKKIARAKAESAAYRYMIKRYVRLAIKISSMWMDTAMEFSDKGCAVISHNEDYINSLAGPISKD